MIVGYTVTLSKVGNSYRVVIPKPACVGLQWNQGDKLNLSVEESKITITKAPSVEGEKRAVVVSPVRPSTSLKGRTGGRKPSSNVTKSEQPTYIAVEPRNNRSRKKKQ
jgi:bifunctional DNA-binding transcriptional regulator/antitoxin component of YhaV-PrlF toxin-antitoxin module